MDRGFSFLLWPKREARRPWKQGRKKRGSITCRTDRANEANKMFIIWLCWLFQFWKGNREPEVRTATYGPGTDQSQHAKSSQPYNNVSYAIASSIVIVFSKPFCCRFLFICRDSKEKEKYLDFFTDKNGLGQCKCCIAVNGRCMTSVLVKRLTKILLSSLFRKDCKNFNLTHASWAC